MEAIAMSDAGWSEQTKNNERPSRRREGTPAETQAYARVFAALGDGTRLQLLQRLSLGEPRSITQLAEESHLTRQAITKHLRVLENVGLISEERRGRETLFTFAPGRLERARQYLESVSIQWDEAVDRLNALVERE